MVQVLCHRPFVVTVTWAARTCRLRSDPEATHGLDRGSGAGGRCTEAAGSRGAPLIGEPASARFRHMAVCVGGTVGTKRGLFESDEPVFGSPSPSKRVRGLNVASVVGAPSPLRGGAGAPFNPFSANPNHSLVQVAQLCALFPDMDPQVRNPGFTQSARTTPTGMRRGTMHSFHSSPLPGGALTDAAGRKTVECPLSRAAVPYECTTNAPVLMSAVTTFSTRSPGSLEPSKLTVNDGESI